MDRRSVLGSQKVSGTQKASWHPKMLTAHMHVLYVLVSTLSFVGGGPSCETIGVVATGLLSQRVDGAAPSTFCGQTADYQAARSTHSYQCPSRLMPCVAQEALDIHILSHFIRLQNEIMPATSDQKEVVVKVTRYWQN
jgi:hypothetical protein